MRRGHALVTDDADFIARWIDPVLRACDFIRTARRETNHEGVPGVLPPATWTCVPSASQETVSPVGDVNADGLRDLLIGDPLPMDSRVFVVLGRKGAH